MRTFDTAAVYFHRFRLRHKESEYNVHDSAMASLFVACKVEDTIKKSKDILCAAYNLKNPDHQTTPDDKVHFGRPLPPSRLWSYYADTGFVARCSSSPPASSSASSARSSR